MKLLQDLLETLKANHRKTVLKMQQDLLDQGWSEVTIKPVTHNGVPPELSDYRLTCKTEGATFEVYAGVIDAKTIVWTVNCDDADHSLIDHEPDQQQVLKEVGAMLIEQQVLVAIKPYADVKDRDADGIPTTGKGYVVAFELDCGKEIMTASETNYVLLAFTNGASDTSPYKVEYCWSNTLRMKSMAHDHEIDKADSIKGLLEILEERLADTSDDDC